MLANEARKDDRRIRLIQNVTAFVGERFEPTLVNLHLSEGRIARVQASQAAVEEPFEGRAIDGRGLLAFPGMVDAHDHLRNLTPGLVLAEGLRLDELLRVMWETQHEMGPTEYRIGALLGCLKHLKTGITTVCDHCYTFHEPGLAEATIEGYEKSGVRWVHARGIMTRPYEPVCETWEEAERDIRDLVGSGRVSREQLLVAPVSIRQARPDDYQRARELADDLGCGLYTHVSETQAEQEVWLEECGAPPIRALDELGFLTPRTVLVHCVILENEDIALLAERGCHVIHCPSNHMKLAKGFTRVPELLAAGVNVALGVDMMSDLLSEMRTEIGMHAVHRLDPNAVSQLEVMRMATERGARALGFGGHVGLLAEGYQADIVLLDGRSILQAVTIDPTYSLLYGSHPGLVRHVLVGGELVVEDGQLLTVDEPAFIEEAESVAAAYMKRIGMEDGPWFLRSSTAETCRRAVSSSSQ